MSKDTSTELDPAAKALKKKVPIGKKGDLTIGDFFVTPAGGSVAPGSTTKINVDFVAEVNFFFFLRKHNLIRMEEPRWRY